MGVSVVVMAQWQCSFCLSIDYGQIDLRSPKRSEVEHSNAQCLSPLTHSFNSIQFFNSIVNLRTLLQSTFW